MEYEVDDLEFVNTLQHDMEYETIDIPTAIKPPNVWTNSETKQLMDLYKNLIGEVGKRFIHKKDMWIEISSKIPKKNPKQCEQRFNTVLKRKRLYTTRGKTRNTIQIKRTFTIEPGAKKYSTNKGKSEYTFNQNDNNTKKEFLNQKCYINKRTKEFNMQETLLFISAKKEEAKERRHREKMEAINKLQLILEQVLESRQN